MLAVIIATGQSLSDEDVETVREARHADRVGAVIAVSNAYEKAPWADALVSYDANWWMAYKPEFDGRRFSCQGTMRSEVYRPPKAINSGLMAMFVARDIYMAETIVLLGFDMHGTHYFGEHNGSGYKPLSNTDEKRFQIHISQFALFSGATVYNATEGSALTRYESVNLQDILNGSGC